MTLQDFICWTGQKWSNPLSSAPIERATIHGRITSFFIPSSAFLIPLSVTHTDCFCCCWGLKVFQQHLTSWLPANLIFHAGSDTFYVCLPVLYCILTIRIFSSIIHLSASLFLYLLRRIVQQPPFLVNTFMTIFLPRDRPFRQGT